MPKRSKKDKKQRSHKYRNKISQKVIQKVIVKIGEERKAKKARRRYKRAQPRDIEQQQMIEELQTALYQQKIPANITYSVGSPFQFSTPQTTQQTSLIEPIRKSVRAKQPEYIAIENEESQPIDVPTKREQLEAFQTPVALSDTITSKVYTAQVFPSERVEGNYSFGVLDFNSEMPPSSALYQNDENLQTSPRLKPQSLGDFLLNKSKTQKEAQLSEEEFGLSMAQIAKSEQAGAKAYKSETETEREVAQPEKKRRERRTKSEILRNKRIELQRLYELQPDVSRSDAFQRSGLVSDKGLDREIRDQKAFLKSLRIKIPKNMPEIVEGQMKNITVKRRQKTMPEMVSMSKPMTQVEAEPIQAMAQFV